MAITRANQRGQSDLDADPLSLPARRKLYGIIHSSPGLHFQALRRKARLSIGEAEYHISVLKNSGLIQGEKMSGFLRFFPATKLTSEQKTLLASVQSKAARQIVGLLLEKKRCGVSDFCARLFLSRKKTVNAVNQLVCARVLVKKKTSLANEYTLSNPVLASKLLSADLKPTKTLSLEDKFEKLWEL